MTTPSMGEMMLVYSRFTFAWASCACAWMTFALATFTSDSPVSTSVCAASTSATAARLCLFSATVRIALHLVVLLRRDRLQLGGLGLLVARLRLKERGLVQLRIDLRDQLTLGDLAVPVRIQLGDAAGDLRADEHGHGRLQGARRGDAADDLPLLHRLGLVRRQRRLVGAAPQEDAADQPGDDEERQDGGEQAAGGSGHGQATVGERTGMPAGPEIFDVDGSMSCAMLP